MCLNSVSFSMINHKKHGLVGVGYKCFETDYRGKLITPHYTVYTQYFKWMKSTNENIRANDFTDYLSGFHIFTQLEDAKYYQQAGRFILKKVFFKDVVGFGKEKMNRFGGKDGDCIIAKKMYILTEKLE